MTREQLENWSLGRVVKAVTSNAFSNLMRPFMRFSVANAANDNPIS